MDKQEKRCPRCGETEKQHKRGLTAAGSQRFCCMKCKKTYTPEPKSHAYSEEVRQLAIKEHFAGVSGREIGKIYGMSKSNVYNWIKKNRSDVYK